MLIIHKPSLGSYEVPHKIEPDRFSRFDVYRTQTNKPTNRQEKYNKDFTYLYLLRIKV